MMEIVKRLTRGADLKISLIELLHDHNTDTAVVLSAVGCLSEINIRLAGAQKKLQRTGDFEIVSLTGTCSRGKVHLHISVADDNGNVTGGHLLEGCIINTTCELVLGVLREHSSERIFDPETGYDEIVFKKLN